jgi:hypothetical protein
MKKEANNMIQVFRNAKAVMTPKQFRNEMIAGVAFILGFPILFAALWVITPA